MVRWSRDYRPVNANEGAEGLLATMYLKCKERYSFSVGTGRNIGLAVGILAGVFGASEAAMAETTSAQATSSIFVDMSLLDNKARRGQTGAAIFLTVPPTRAPISTLHIAPKKKLELRAPTVARENTSTKPAKQTDLKPAQKKTTTTPPSKPKPLKSARAATPNPAPPPPSPAANINTAAPPPPPAVTTPLPPAPKIKSEPPAAPEVTKSPPPTATPLEASAPEVARLPAKLKMKPGRALQIAFNETETRLPDAEKARLLNLANAVREERRFRLQLRAYAGGQDLSTSKARRMSLSRALAVRAFLIDKGVRSTQIDVRALGSKTSEKPVNRIDLILTKR